MRTHRAALLGASWLAFAGAAWAQDPVEERLERIAALEAHLAEIETQIGELRERVAADATAEAARDAAASANNTNANTTVQVTLSNGRPTITSADGQSRFAIRGQFQYDEAQYEQSGAPTPDNRRSDASNPGDLSAGANFRRARLGFDGAYRDWNYSLSFGLVGGGAGGEDSQLAEAFIEYAGWKPFDDAAPVRLRIGAWGTPTGLDDATSNIETLFLERAAITELMRGIAGGDGRTGIGVFVNDQRWYGSFTLTGASIGNTGEFDEQSNYIARLALLPLHGEHYGLHTGVSAIGVANPADTNSGTSITQTLRLRERSELRVDAQRFVDTGAIASDGLTAYGLELGGFWNNLYAAGEVFQIDLSRTDGLADPRFSGWYVQGAWTLSGEQRRWNAANGGFQSVRPDRPFNVASSDWGAWEIAARYSVLTLNHNEGMLGHATPAGGVRGGEQTITTIGLNWYPNNITRFLLDYQWVEIDRLDPENNSIVTPAPGIGAQVGQGFEALSLRSQIAF
ncbi:MAG: porin [Terricaulis sp.]